ncbi:MAG TPA: hypothetical protein EYQ75_17380 [Planctomycetaceae bacterium]|nr:hypothetical protein [Planctomycetaceae bacterium]
MRILLLAFLCGFSLTSNAQEKQSKPSNSPDRTALRFTGGRGTLDTNRARADVRGEVLATRGKFLELSVGADDGLKIGDTVEVYRDKSYLGRAVVRHMSDDRAVAEALAEFRKGEIKKGDRFATKLTNPPVADAKATQMQELLAKLVELQREQQKLRAAHQLRQERIEAEKTKTADIDKKKQFSKQTRKPPGKRKQTPKETGKKKSTPSLEDSATKKLAAIKKKQQSAAKYPGKEIPAANKKPASDKHVKSLGKKSPKKGKSKGQKPPPTINGVQTAELEKTIAELISQLNAVKTENAALKALIATLRDEVAVSTEEALHQRKLAENEATRAK